MHYLGRITVRGPYSTYEKKRIGSLIDNHPFNTEVTCFLPFLHQNEISDTNSKGIESNDEDDDFLSFSQSKSVVFNDSSLIKETGFYYRIKGPLVSLFQEPFYSQYVSVENGLTLSTINTPTALSNSVCIINGLFLTFRVDKETYNQLGILGKHASARILSDNIYLCTIKLKGLALTSKQMQRIIDCISSIPPLEMICFYGNQQIQFPSAIQVQSITNSLESSRVATVDIPVFQTSIIENALKANEIDKKSIPESIYKEEKMNFQYNREEIIHSVLDWIGLVDAKSVNMNTDVSKELSSFEIPGCFPIVKASNSNYVKIYRNSGYLAPITIKDKLEFLEHHVNSGKSPFAVLSVYGDVNCSCQWIINSKESEFDYLWDDDAHYVILILPDSKIYTFLSSSDLETRLYYCLNKHIIMVLINHLMHSLWLHGTLHLFLFFQLVVLTPNDYTSLSLTGF